MEPHRYPAESARVVRSAVQRGLLAWWEQRSSDGAPAEVDLLGEEPIVLHLNECIFYQTIEAEDGVDFLATLHGADVHPLFGMRLTGTRLREHAPPNLVEEVVDSYRVCVASRRPVYTIRHARDLDAHPVEIEILRLPLRGETGMVDSILSHFVTTSVAAEFNRRMLVPQGSTESYALAVIIGAT